jgi:hypothetical protein
MLTSRTAANSARRSYVSASLTIIRFASRSRVFAASVRTTSASWLSRRAVGMSLAVAPAARTRTCNEVFQKEGQGTYRMIERMGRNRYHTHSGEATNRKCDCEGSISP